MANLRRLRVASYGNNEGLDDMLKMRQKELQLLEVMRKNKLMNDAEDISRKDRIKVFDMQYQLASQTKKPQIGTVRTSQPFDNELDSYKSNFNQIKHVFEKSVPREEDRCFAHQLRYYPQESKQSLKDTKKRSVTSYQPSSFTDRVDFDNGKQQTICDIKPSKLDVHSKFDHIMRPKVNAARDKNVINYQVQLRSYDQDTNKEKGWNTLPYIRKKGKLPYEVVPLCIDPKKYEQSLKEKQQRLEDMKKDIKSNTNLRSFSFNRNKSQQKNPVVCERYKTSINKKY